MKNLYTLVFASLWIWHSECVSYPEDERSYQSVDSRFLIDNPNEATDVQRFVQYYKSAKQIENVPNAKYEYPEEPSYPRQYQIFPKSVSFASDPKDYKVSAAKTVRPAKKPLMVEQFLKEVTPTTKTVYARYSQTYKLATDQNNNDDQPDQSSISFLQKDPVNHYIVPAYLEKKHAPQLVDEDETTEPKFSQSQISEYDARIRYNPYSNTIPVSQRAVEEEAPKTSIFVNSNVPRKHTEKIVKTKHVPADGIDYYQLQQHQLKRQLQLRQQEQQKIQQQLIHQQQAVHQQETIQQQQTIQQQLAIQQQQVIQQQQAIQKQQTIQQQLRPRKLEKHRQFQQHAALEQQQPETADRQTKIRQYPKASTYRSEAQEQYQVFIPQYQQPTIQYNSENFEPEIKSPVIQREQELINPSSEITYESTGEIENSPRRVKHKQISPVKSPVNKFIASRLPYHLNKDVSENYQGQIRQIAKYILPENKALINQQTNIEDTDQYEQQTPQQTKIVPYQEAIAIEEPLRQKQAAYYQFVEDDKKYQPILHIRNPAENLSRNVNALRARTTRYQTPKENNEEVKYKRVKVVPQQDEALTKYQKVITKLQSMGQEQDVLYANEDHQESEIKYFKPQRSVQRPSNFKQIHENNARFYKPLEAPSEAYDESY